MTDIETALAEALHGNGDDGCNGPLGTCDIQGQFIDDAAAILATEPMQAIARQAAIGAAVERLADTGEVDPHLYFTDAVYHALAYRVHRGTPPDAAIAAALEDDR